MIQISLILHQEWVPRGASSRLEATNQTVLDVDESGVISMGFQRRYGFLTATVMNSPCHSPFLTENGALFCPALTDDVTAQHSFLAGFSSGETPRETALA